MSKFAHYLHHDLASMGFTPQRDVVPHPVVRVVGPFAGTKEGERVLNAQRGAIQQRIAAFRQLYLTGVVTQNTHTAVLDRVMMRYSINHGQEIILLEPKPALPPEVPPLRVPPDVLMIELLFEDNRQEVEVPFWIPRGTFTYYGDPVQMDVSIEEWQLSTSFDSLGLGVRYLGTIITPRDLFPRFDLRSDPEKDAYVGIDTVPAEYLGGWPRWTISEAGEAEARLRLLGLGGYGALSDAGRELPGGTNPNTWAAFLDAKWYRNQTDVARIQIRGFWRNVFARNVPRDPPPPPTNAFQAFSNLYVGSDPDGRRPAPTYTGANYSDEGYSYLREPFFDQSQNVNDRRWYVDPILPPPTPHDVKVVGTWVWYPQPDYPIEQLVSEHLYDPARLSEVTHISKVLGTVRVSSVIVGQHWPGSPSVLPWGDDLGTVVADFKTLGISLRPSTPE